MADSKLLDSTTWVDYLIKKTHTEIIDSEEKLFLSVLSIFEIKKKLIKDKLPKEDIKKSIKFLKEKSIILPVTEKIAERAAEIANEKDMTMADSIIYVTSLFNNSKLLTLDNDFRGLENVEILD